MELFGTFKCTIGNHTLLIELFRVSNTEDHSIVYVLQAPFEIETMFMDFTELEAALMWCQCQILGSILNLEARIAYRNAMK